jgi:hypothetical protein
MAKVKTEINIGDLVYVKGWGFFGEVIAKYNKDIVLALFIPDNNSPNGFKFHHYESMSTYKNDVIVGQENVLAYFKEELSISKQKLDALKPVSNETMEANKEKIQKLTNHNNAMTSELASIYQRQANPETQTKSRQSQIAHIEKAIRKNQRRIRFLQTNGSCDRKCLQIMKHSSFCQEQLDMFALFANSREEKLAKPKKAIRVTERRIKKELDKIISENYSTVDQLNKAKNHGIYEFELDGLPLSLGISFEDLEEIDGVFIFNVFVKEEYINIPGQAILDNGQFVGVDWDGSVTSSKAVLEEIVKACNYGLSILNR